MVTGVSTGALIAPFAFLGPGLRCRPARGLYDHDAAKASIRTRGISAALFDDAMADTAPLADVIAKYADQKMLAAIAREYGEGPPAADRHHRPRRPAAGDLEHRRHRGERPSRGARALPQDPARLGGDPRRFPAGDDRRRARRQEISGDACRRRRHRPALPLSAVDRCSTERRPARSATPTSSATPGSIPTMPWPSAGPSRSPAAPSPRCWPPAVPTTCCAPISSPSATASTTTSPT